MEKDIIVDIIEECCISDYNFFYFLLSLDNEITIKVLKSNIPTYMISNYICDTWFDDHFMLLDKIKIINNYKKNKIYFEILKMNGCLCTKLENLDYGTFNGKNTINKILEDNISYLLFALIDFESEYYHIEIDDIYCLSLNNIKDYKLQIEKGNIYCKIYIFKKIIKKYENYLTEDENMMVNKFYENYETNRENRIKVIEIFVDFIFLIKDI